MVSRRVGAWLVAAVVTVALVAGGVLVARGGADRSPAVLPALDLAGTGAQGGDAGGAVEPAIEPARPDAGGDAPQLWPPLTYKLKGPLPALPDRARAWTVGDDVDPGRLAALAAALGLPGQPKEAPDGWTVGEGGRTLTVHRLAGVPWSYGTDVMRACVVRSGGPYQPATGLQCLDPDTPVSDTPMTPSSAGATARSSGSGASSSPGDPGTGKPLPPATVKPVVPGRPVRPDDLPSREQAERIARDLAARAGLDLDGAQVRVADTLATRLVTIAPAVDGATTTNFPWTVGVGSKGRVQHASGYLARPEPADTYPLIGVAEGFERLRRTPPFRHLLGSETAVAEAPCPPATKLPCTTRPLERRVATVTGVSLGLQLVPTLPSGDRPAATAYLLPAYLFQLEGGWTDVRAVVAVADRYLTNP
jgi:hypothetical protein